MYDHNSPEDRRGIKSVLEFTMNFGEQKPIGSYCWKNYSKIPLLNWEMSFSNKEDASSLKWVDFLT